MSLEKEILKLKVQLERETNKDIRKILLGQKRQLEKMRKNIGNMYMKYGNDEGKLIINSIDRAKIMRNIEKDIIDMSQDIISSTTKITDETLLKSYIDSYYKTANIVDKGISTTINFKLLRPEFVESVLKTKFENMTYSDRIWKNTGKLANQLYDVIGNGISEGHNIQKMSKEIKNSFGVSSYDAKRLVNDQMTRVVSQAQDQIYQDSGVINEIMFVATLDNSTSEICESLDGNKYDINGSYPSIPGDTHIGCRSCYVPVVSNYSPTTRRDNKSKEEIPYQSYKDWKKDN